MCSSRRNCPARDDDARRDRPKAAHEQAFLQQVVRGVLPLGTGVILAPFAGSGSTLAAAEAVGYASIAIERDREYFHVARTAIPALSVVSV